MMTQAAMMPMFISMLTDYGSSIDEVMELYHGIDYPESWPPGLPLPDHFK